MLLDGVDVRTLNLRSLHACMAIVGQEPVLFAGTIEFNLKFGSHRTDITRAEVGTSAPLRAIRAGAGSGVQVAECW